MTVNRRPNFDDARQNKDLIYEALLDASEGPLIIKDTEAWRFVELKLVKCKFSTETLHNYLQTHWFEYLYSPTNCNEGQVFIGWTTWKGKCDALVKRGIFLQSEYEKIIKMPADFNKTTGLY